MDDEHYQGLAGIRLALRHFVAASEQINRKAGITQQQYQALLAIKTWPGGRMAIKDLADQLLVTHHGAVQLVDRLVKVGVAVREPSTQDRRTVLLKLTPAGEQLLGELAARHLDEMLRQEPLLTQSLRRLRRIGPEA